MDKIKKVFSHLSLRRSFILIVSIAAVLVILLSAGASGICNRIRNQIISRHSIQFEPFVFQPNGDGSVSYKGGQEEQVEFSDSELLICRIMETLIVLLPIIFALAGVGCAASVFYRLKLKKPLGALNQGISHIIDNDLDFSITYREPDELGRICSAFDTMREELIRNKKSMWDMVDERKKINASVAHDLRTPITVIKGYSEYLERNLEKGRLTAENTLEIVEYIRQAAGRLEQYADSVQDVQTLEDINLDYRETGLTELFREAQSQLAVMARESGRSIQACSELPDQKVLIAPDAVFRILENIVKNACRYCKNGVTVVFSLNEQRLMIETVDDGAGFSEQDRKEALNFFYKDTKEKNHFGIGLTICRILCEKHGGSITLSNAPSGGAKVTVQLKTEPVTNL